ncbi:unnamed protein product, partial [Timema podura]|nr:unnamed protein product [Timema podura]
LQNDNSAWFTKDSAKVRLYCTLRVEPPIDFSRRAKMTGEVKQDTCATTNKTQGEDGKDTFISCKQLWRTISGKCYKVTKSTVSKKLDEASLMIQQGLEFYHPPNPSTDVEIQKEISPPIYKILFKLRTFL